jgi:hypothetical protein
MAAWSVGINIGIECGVHNMPVFYFRRGLRGYKRGWCSAGFTTIGVGGVGCHRRGLGLAGCDS